MGKRVSQSQSVSSVRVQRPRRLSPRTATVDRTDSVRAPAPLRFPSHSHIIADAVHSEPARYSKDILTYYALLPLSSESKQSSAQRSPRGGWMCPMFSVVYLLILPLRIKCIP